MNYDIFFGVGCAGGEIQASSKGVTLETKSLNDNEKEEVGVSRKYSKYQIFAKDNKPTDLVYECWENNLRTVIKSVLKKNGKVIYEDSDWFKK